MVAWGLVSSWTQGYCFLYGAAAPLGNNYSIIILLGGHKWIIITLTNQDNYPGEKIMAYQSFAFTPSMMDENGEHDPLFDESVKVYWDCTEWHRADSEEEFDCDWESGAETT